MRTLEALLQDAGESEDCECASCEIARRIRALLELHADTNGVCAVCVDGEEFQVPSPCPTVKIMEGKKRR